MNYDQRHRAYPLVDIPDDQPVWVNTDGQQQQGRTVSTTEAPRSYLLGTPSGRVTRNHQHLTPIHSSPQSSQNDTSTTGTSTCVTRNSPVKARSQTGIKVTPPERLTY